MRASTNLIRWCGILLKARCGGQRVACVQYSGADGDTCLPLWEDQGCVCYTVLQDSSFATIPCGDEKVSTRSCKFRPGLGHYAARLWQPIWPQCWIPRLLV